MEALRTEQGKEQMQPLIDKYTCEYDGQGTSQFAIQLQQLCLNAQRSVPGLPKSAAAEKKSHSHPGTSGACGIQLFVCKLGESL